MQKITQDLGSRHVAHPLVGDHRHHVLVDLCERLARHTDRDDLEFIGKVVGECVEQRRFVVHDDDSRP
jgi:hypothetical protein